MLLRGHVQCMTNDHPLKWSVWLEKGWVGKFRDPWEAVSGVDPKTPDSVPLTHPLEPDHNLVAGPHLGALWTILFLKQGSTTAVLEEAKLRKKSIVSDKNVRQAVRGMRDMGSEMKVLRV